MVITADGVARITAQVLLIVVARLVGPAEFGDLVTLLTILMVLSSISDLGVGEASVQHFTDTVDGRERFLGGNAQARLGSAAGFSAVLLTLLSVAAGVGLVDWWVALAVMPLAPLALLTNQPLALRIDERLLTATLLASLISLLQYGAVAVGVLVRPTAEAGYVALTVAVTFVAIPLWRRQPRLRFGAWRSAASRGFPFLIAAAAAVLYTRGDRLVLAMFTDGAEVGIYSAAYTLILGFSLVGTAISAFALPAAIRIFRDGQPQQPRMHLLKHTIILGLTGIAFAITVIVFREPLIVRIYGPQFEASAAILPALAWIIPLYFVNPYLSSTLVGAGRPRAIARVAIANLGLALVLYPAAAVSGGGYFLALASLTVEVFGFAVMYAMVHRLVRPNEQ